MESIYENVLWYQISVVVKNLVVKLSCNEKYISGEKILVMNKSAEFLILIYATQFPYTRSFRLHHNVL